MRRQIEKLRKGKSTKYERRFMELLKENHIPFKAKVMIGGREVDFLVGRYAIDIDGHEQFKGKNEMLVKLGYIPLHFSNTGITNKLDIKNLWQK